MEHDHVRDLLAVSPREWSDAARVRVETHLPACPDCTALARAYAEQERLMSALPRPGMSLARQQAILAQTHRDASRAQLRARLSNALGTVAALLSFGALAVLLITLLRDASPASPPGVVSRPRFRAEDIQLVAEVRLTQDNGDVAFGWSPDGSRLLLSRSERLSEDGGQDGEMALLDVTTGNLQSLPRPGLNPIWAPDGNAILFNGADQAGDRRLWLYTLSDSRLTMLTTAPPPHFGMWWLPDGRLLYQDEDGLWAIPVSSASSEVPAPPGTPQPTIPQLVPPLDLTDPRRWILPAPDGSAIVLYDGTVDNDRHMWMVRPDGSRVEFDQPRGSPGTCCAWAPDGSHFAFFSPQPEYGLYVVDRAGQSRRLVLAASTLGEGLFISMSFSPDGQVIAFEWSKAGPGAPFDNTQIYLVNLDGSGTRQLTPDTSVPHLRLNWSPDGRHIAFRRPDGSVWVAQMVTRWQTGIATPLSPVAGYAPTPPTAVASPTSPPPPTMLLPDGSFATPTPVTPDPVYATQEAALQATIAAAQATAVARATASPFPTAGPPIIHIGRPALALKQRDGLSFTVRLPTDTYLAGEGGLADITLRNDSSETLVFQDARVVLLDEQGHELDPWPWSPMTFPGRFPRYGLGRLVAGGELTHTLRFQVPPVDRAAGHTHALWVETEFSRALPGYPEGQDNIWLRLETGPIPLKVIAPDPAQQLRAELQVDWNGWRLQVTDANGQAPPAPLWGEIEAVLPNGAMAGPLHPQKDSADGVWSGTWEAHRLTPGEGIIVVRAWVAVPGYAIAPVIQAVPHDTPGEEVHRRLAAFEPPTRQTFESIEAAQAALGLPLYAPHRLPPGMTPETITIETGLPDSTLRMRARGMYRLPDGNWLELIQMVTSDDVDYAGWGQARYTPENQLVTAGQTTGYVVQRFGRWVLDWKVAGTGFELRVPATALSLDELLAIAAAVQPFE